MTAVAKHTEFSLLADLAHTGAVTDTGLYLEPDTPYEQWAALGMMLRRLDDAAIWIRGDWVNYGETAYGEKYAQAVSETGLAEQTLMNDASLARKFPPERRRLGLRPTHHAVVRSLPIAEQEQWLDRAEAEGWSRRELEQHVKGAEEPERHNCPDCGREHVVQQPREEEE